jgi:hypothetical protein
MQFRQFDLQWPFLAVILLAGHALRRDAASG